MGRPARLKAAAPPKAVASPREQHRERLRALTRQSILQAAEAVLLREGLDALTLDAIAAELGLTKQGQQAGVLLAPQQQPLFQGPGLQMVQPLRPDGHWPTGRVGGPDFSKAAAPAMCRLRGSPSRRSCALGLLCGIGTYRLARPRD